MHPQNSSKFEKEARSKKWASDIYCLAVARGNIGFYQSSFVYNGIKTISNGFSSFAWLLNKLSNDKTEEREARFVWQQRWLCQHVDILIIESFKIAWIENSCAQKY